MSRQAEQVHIYIYRKKSDGNYEYGVFQRSDNELWWQGVTGGVEKDETLEEAARREIFEEAGIKDKYPLYRLDNKSYLPGDLFNEETQRRWGKDIVVIPMYFFAMEYSGEIKISHEHTHFTWLSYKEAEEIIYFHDQKVGLWELKERLKRSNLKRKD